MWAADVESNAAVDVVHLWLIDFEMFDKMDWIKEEIECVCIVHIASVLIFLTNEIMHSERERGLKAQLVSSIILFELH